MKKEDAAVFIPLNILLAIAFAGVQFGVNGLVFCGIVMAPIALFLVFSLFIEAAWGIKPVSIVLFPLTFIVRLLMPAPAAQLA